MSKLKILFLLLAVMLPALNLSAADNNKVTGTVLDDTGSPVIGASVVPENAKQGVSTDIDGNFVLPVKGFPVTLKVTSVGYDAKTVKVANAQHVTITLGESSELLDEVVVIGYGTVKKADMAGSVAVLDSKAFAAQPIVSAGDAIQGRVSGVNVFSSGVPGAAPQIRVRGSNSINKSNEPLYVVDGLIRESGLEGINPEDIASMQILKDASSTAIYGSRGANGVVIITTKGGKKGESAITFDATYGISNATHLPKVMGTKQYAEALVQYAKIPDTQLTEYLDGSDPGINWQDLMFRTGATQNYKVVYSKGVEGMQAYVSANYMNEKGVITNSQYERFSARANVKTDITSWLNATVDVDLSHGVGHGIGGFDLSTGPIWAAFTFSPSMKMYDADGVTFAKDPYNSIMYNPYGELTIPNERVRDIVNGHLDLRFNLCKGLTFTTSNGVDYANMYGYGMSPSWRAAGLATGMSNSNSNRWLLQSTNNLTYMGQWGDHSLTATGVWEATSATTKNMGISGDNLLTESTGWWNVAATKTQHASNGYSKWTLMSAVGRAIYNYANRYMLTATFRADGSSRLQKNRWSTFPSLALAWTVSNESFMESIRPVMNNLKLRTSWGVIGNQDISPYQTLGLMSQVQVYYGSTVPTVGYWSDRVTTPDLRWERTRQVDFGVDMAFLNGRFDLNLDWYYKRTSDALLQTTPPAYLGGAPYYVNAGEVSNTGLDLGINANIIQGADWNWTTGLQGSYMKNRIEKLTALEPVIYSGSTQSILFDALVVKEGQPIGAFYGYRWAGVDADGYDTYYTKDGDVTRTPSADDRDVLGKAQPDFTLGWNNTVTYRNWSLNVFMNSSFGGQRLNALRYAMNTMIGNSRFVTDASWLDEVGKTMADPSRYENNTCMGESTKWLEKADYCRLENLSLAYDFKRKLTKFADIRLSASVQNLFTITNYKGVNPAALSFGGVEWKKGIDMGTAPAPRTFTFGVRLIL